MKLRVCPSRLKGTALVPPSKSHTLRALLFGLMGRGTTHVHNYLHSPDTDAMIQAVCALGAQVEVEPTVLKIEGTAGKLQPAHDVINAGNSGIVLRFIGALAALLPTFTILTGDASIRTRRLAAPLLEGLKQLGAEAFSMRQDGFAPLIIRGPLHPGKATIEGEDSQPVSGLLIATSFLEGSSEICVKNPGEKPWIQLTLDWFDRLGIRYKNENFEKYTLFGNATYPGFSYTVPGDFSSAAYPLVAALLTDSELTIENLDFHDAQGDKKVIDILKKMGARIACEEKCLHVQKGGSLRGIKIDVGDTIDALPILAVVGCFAEGVTEITGGKIARSKESDRIHAIATELKKMGAHIEEREDGLRIFPSRLRGEKLFSHHDQRIALSLAVAALAAHGESVIEEAHHIRKTYPHFVPDFCLLGAEMEMS